MKWNEKHRHRNETRMKSWMSDEDGDERKGCANHVSLAGETLHQGRKRSDLIELRSPHSVKHIFVCLILLLPHVIPVEEGKKSKDCILFSLLDWECKRDEVYGSREMRGMLHLRTIYSFLSFLLTNPSSEERERNKSIYRSLYVNKREALYFHRRNREKWVILLPLSLLHLLLSFTSSSCSPYALLE